MDLDLDLDRNSCICTSCYCEENIWKLCEQLSNEHPQFFRVSFVVFISNAKRCVCLFEQKSSRSPSQIPVFWDYHVILIVAAGSSPLVYDLDSVLPFPVSLSTYVERAFHPELEPRLIADQIPRMLRIIPASKFISEFASDRSHMWDSEQGAYRMPPPPYPCIKTENSSNNIQDFIEMTPERGSGLVLTLTAALQEICISSSQRFLLDFEWLYGIRERHPNSSSTHIRSLVEH